MCGIFGIIAKTYDNPAILNSLLLMLAALSESRGKDSSGIAVRNESLKKLNVFKGPVQVTELLSYPELTQELKACTGQHNGSGTKPGHPVFLAFGHARLVTNGTQLDDCNNQPVVKDDIVAVHNGIIVNVEDLWRKYPSLTRSYEIDTEIMLAMLRAKIDDSANLRQSIVQTVQEIFGTVATAMYLASTDQFILTTNNGSLYIMTNHKDLLVFGSERYILEEAARDKKIRKVYPGFRIFHVRPNTGYLVDIPDFQIQHFTFDDNPGDQHGSRSDVQAFSVDTKTLGVDREKRPVIVDIGKFRLSPESINEERLLEYNLDEVLSLKRCTRCLLPETFPYIQFDSEGVCNFCNHYQPRSRANNLTELRKLTEPFRKNNGEPDCIVPFSGGRDSTFALHMIKKELGMNPLAFTYDWGMVTDLARRNIARVCGTLGVENIIVAADIRWKRQNIRKNISAWLKNPALGMIPLFMAGDKFFFYYTNQLKKQSGITLNIWGINYLENTDFKTGFANIEPTFDKSRIYSLSLLDKMKLFNFVGRNLLANPSYMNQSVFDTLGSFFARYIAPKKDYFHFFDFYPWNEQEIEQAILENYQWETATDTKSTWRIGDGTASFYNYIYFTVAGFSENETFRSNQIREGMINREEAFKKVLEANQPRYESIKWYLEIIGLDFKTVVKRINSIPKLYRKYSS